ncbi:conserved hypothetical protein [Verticillium alfalfae VaMs.102]|uniref:GST N-terminal domain-containing protein n=1 Tax=Verticillium alfalfae (strain VaMs.102 / ATCC MYA-4576 / FGSC 10136) TaxID=526221 RepID=C9SWI8_VERA1|nr:conserved hypothetical protein [Verticillium alfalfae VaMs.102]EEY23153.1 conserved hypothetical protein [Verticillium alfalfae VaMs.102]
MHNDAPLHRGLEPSDTMWSREGAACTGSIASACPTSAGQAACQEVTYCSTASAAAADHILINSTTALTGNTQCPRPSRSTTSGLRPPAAKNCCSAEPLKTRFRLQLQGAAHTTKWVALPDIVNLRTTLKVAPTRKFADGSDFFTLPIIEDASTGTTLGDSLDIAVYLQQTYPSAGEGDLFPEQPLDYTFDPAEGLLVPLSAVRDSPYPAYATFTSRRRAFTAYTQLTTVGPG